MADPITDPGEISAIEYKLQTRVARFLALKEPLVGLTKHPDPAISQKARELIAEQLRLEQNLSKMLDVLKTRNFNVTNVADLTIYAFDFEKQINNAESFMKSTGVPTSQAGTGISTSDIMKYGLIAGGVVALAWILTRKS